MINTKTYKYIWCKYIQNNISAMSAVNALVVSDKNNFKIFLS